MSTKLPAGTLDKLWADSANWRGCIYYVCKEDPRLIVPKRPKWGGWTLNFAHAAVWLLLLGVFLSILIPAVFFLLGSRGIVPGLLSEAAVIGSWCIASVVLSSPRRYEAGSGDW